MGTIIKKKEQARFDTRLPKEQKQFFEKAAAFGGYRNLTDFVLFAAQEKANKIIEEKEKIIASDRDGELFFEAVTNPEKPNKALRNAADEYNAFVSKSGK